MFNNGTVLSNQFLDLFKKVKIVIFNKFISFHAIINRIY